ncbi:response regulator transcription factor [Mucilaginibacter sp. Bleaf8]|uniref:LytR/AlgR family response regulator transcription factor n=1 Tax=Mucilaginibacter sp. Bleaf8 TaxID=2834430 RepID=UPI001BD02F69|nr:LytTR family DNA-binding domain-containing protein [Mucilaginibacter sp. Bleaf8]MBS7564806.1 response regulator transcription factor [Mucilaginibacter sp. Bleaf8]
MNVLIVEDEELAANMLQAMLLEIDPAIHVSAVLETIDATVHWLQRNQVELIFMDIHLGDGESFSIFKQVKVTVPVIFTTAYDQYTLKAFKNQGIDYLLKPYDKAELENALDKLNLIRNVSGASPQPAFIPPGQYRNRFMIKSGKLIKSIHVSEVAYFMAEDKYLFLVTREGQQFIIDETLSSLEPQLDVKDFCRISRKFILHITSINKMYMLSRNRVRIILQPAAPEGVDVIVTEERADFFKRWLDQ